MPTHSRRTALELKECNYSKDHSQRNNVRDPCASRSFLRRLSMRNLNIDASIRRLTSAVPVFATESGTVSQRKATRRPSAFFFSFSFSSRRRRRATNGASKKRKQLPEANKGSYLRSASLAFIVAAGFSL